MSDAVTYMPFLVIAVFAVFAAWAMRGKEIPDRVVGVAAPIGGAGSISSPTTCPPWYSGSC